MKKIKVFIDVYYYKAALSGIKTYIKELKHAMDLHGSKRVEYVFSHELSDLSNNQTYLNSKNQIIRWIFQLNYLVWKQLILPFKLFWHRPDYLICPDYILPMINFKTKKFSVIHDSLFWDYPENYSLLWRKYYIKLIDLGIDKKTKIITTSNYSKKNLQKIFKKNCEIDYIYQSFEKPFTNEINSNFSINIPKSYILHVGSFEKRKNLITLVKAFNEIKKGNKNKELKLVMAGAQVVNGNKKVINHIKNYIHKNNLHNEIILPGYISDEITQTYYQNAMFYIFPSLDEGFGIPIIESFTYSLPVICSNIPIFKEIGGESVVYFTKDDHISLAEKIQALIDSKDLRLKFITKGKYQLNKFSRKNFIEGFEEIIFKNNNE